MANIVLGADTTQVDKGVTSLDALTEAAHKTASGLRGLFQSEEQLWEAGAKLVLKLDELVATFGMTTEQIYTYRAAQLGVTKDTEAFIATLTNLKRAREEDAIQQKRDLELYRERSAAATQTQKEIEAEANAYFAAENRKIAISQDRDVQLHQMRTKEAADAIALRDRQAEAYFAAVNKEIEIEQRRDLAIYEIRSKAESEQLALRDKEAAGYFAAMNAEIAIEQKRDLEIYEMRSKAAAELIALRDREAESYFAAINAQIATEQKRDLALYEMRSKSEADLTALRDKDATAYFAAMNAEIAIEQKRDVEIYEMRAKTAAAAIALRDKEAEAYFAAVNAEIAIEQKRDLEMYEIRSKAEKAQEALQVKEAEAYFAEVNAEIAAAEKLAIEQIKWGETSLKAKIQQLERLKEYQASAAISPQTVERTFGNAAINDLPNLGKYQQELASAEGAAARGAAGVKAGAKGASEALGEMGVQTSKATTELVVLAREGSRGNFSRMAGSFTILAQAMGGLLNPITLVGAGVAFVGYEMLKGAQEQEKMIGALVSTGHYAGVTADALDHLAHSAVASGGSLTVAKEAALQLASSGRFTSDQIAKITESAVIMERMTGQSVGKTIEVFKSLAVQQQGDSVRAADAITRAVVKADEEHHAFTATILEQIHTLARNGDAMGATNLAIDTLAQKTKDRGKEMQEDIGYIAQAWHSVKDRIVEATSAVGDWGKHSTGFQAKAVQDQIDVLSAREATPGSTRDRFKQEELKELNLKLAMLRDQEHQQSALAEEDGRKARVHGDAVIAQGKLIAYDDERRIKNLGKLAAAQEEFNAQIRQMQDEYEITGVKNPRLDPEYIKQHRLDLIKDNTAKSSHSTSKEDGYARATLQDIVGPTQQAIAGEAKSLAETQSLLDKQYAQGDVSLNDYLNREQVARKKALDATLIDYDIEIKATERYIATVKDATKQLAGQTLLKEEKNKRDRYIKDYESKDSIGNENDQKKIQDYSDTVAKLNIQLATLEGRFYDAAVAQDELTNRLLRKKLNTEASNGSPETSAAALEALAALDKGQKNTFDKSKITQQTYDYNLVLEKQATLEGRIALEQQKGNLGEVEGLILVSQAREKEIEELYKIVAAKEALTDKTPKEIADLAAFKLKIDQMAASSDVLAIRINNLVEGPLETFFVSMMTKPKNIGQAFMAMGNTIAMELDKIAAKEIATNLLGTGGSGGSGGFGGLISGLIGGLLGGYSGIGGGMAGTTQIFGMGGAGAAGAPGFTMSSGFATGISAADGGDPPVGVPSWVGERGPELFVPKTSGTVIPNHVLNGQSSGDVTNLHQTVNFMLNQPATRETQSQIANAAFTAGSRMARRNS